MGGGWSSLWNGNTSLPRKSYNTETQPLQGRTILFPPLGPIPPTSEDEEDSEDLYGSYRPLCQSQMRDPQTIKEDPRKPAFIGIDQLLNMDVNETTKNAKILGQKDNNYEAQNSDSQKSNNSINFDISLKCAIDAESSPVEKEGVCI